MSHDPSTCTICIEVVEVVESRGGAGLSNQHLHAHLHRIEYLIHKVLVKEDTIVATLSDFTDEFDSIDATLAAEGADVEAINAKIAQLEGQIGSGGLTADEEATIKARLDASKAALENLKATLDTTASG